jgi:hypothetical protein
VLAVVEHNEQPAICDVVEKRGGERPPHLLADPERLCHGLRDEPAVGQPSQLYEPHAVTVVLHELSRDLEREPGLSAAAGSREGDEACLREQSFHGGDVFLAADERRQLGGKVVP